MVTNAGAVTVFNGRTDRKERREKYIPTVIRGVSYVEGKGSRVTNNGVWSDDVQYKIRIPLSAEVQAGRRYMPELAYAVLDDSAAAGCWTIRKGDFMLRGAHALEEPLLYEDGIKRYAQEHGLDLIRITEYADNTDGGRPYMRHWRIGGK